VKYAFRPPRQLSGAYAPTFVLGLFIEWRGNTWYTWTVEDAR
jgi:hypothetical protein